MKWKFYQPIFEYEEMYLDLGGPWFGHKYFAYDLIQNIRPKKVVELGTHLGCSLFSFSQAIKDSKLNTSIDAVDTWLGDEHAGDYSEIIINKVKEIKNKYYSKLKIKLLRKTFDQANQKYPDNSIDILHIDGYHTYEAVKHDYDMWFDKVKEDGIILLHDSAVKDSNFGIHKLLKQIKKDYKIIEFPHSYGLGVVFKSAKTYYDISSLLPLLTLYYDELSQKKQLKWKLNQKKITLNKYKRSDKNIIIPAHKISKIVKIIKQSKL